MEASVFRTRPCGIQNVISYRYVWTTLYGETTVEWLSIPTVTVGDPEKTSLPIAGQKLKGSLNEVAVI